MMKTKNQVGHEHVSWKHPLFFIFIALPDIKPSALLALIITIASLSVFLDLGPPSSNSFYSSI